MSVIYYHTFVVGIYISRSYIHPKHLQKYQMAMKGKSLSELRPTFYHSSTTIMFQSFCDKNVYIPFWEIQWYRVYLSLEHVFILDFSRSPNGYECKTFMVSNIRSFASNYNLCAILDQSPLSSRRDHIFLGERMISVDPVLILDFSRGLEWQRIEKHHSVHYKEVCW